MGLDMHLLADKTEIGYWRKANAIHAWFVNNVQNGVDDCNEYPVSKEQLTCLRDTCLKVLDSCKLIPGQVYCGSRSTNGSPWERIYEPGQIIEDPSVAIELLPSTAGVFFGDTNYDERYLQKLKATVKFCEAALKLNNVSYASSW